MPALRRIVFLLAFSVGLLACGGDTDGFEVEDGDSDPAPPVAVVQPDTISPSVALDAEPDIVQPEAAGLETVGPDTDEPDAAEPDAAEPVAAEPDAAETVATPSSSTTEPAPPGSGAAAIEGKTLFVQSGCTACHGPTAAGTPIGPDLTDATWLNIQTPVTLEKIVAVVRSGVAQPVQFPAPMPPMGGASLDDNALRAISAFIFSLSQ